MRDEDAPFPKEQFQAAVAAALCWSDVLRTLGYEPKGHNIRTVQRWAKAWSVHTGHFDPNLVRARATRARARDLSEIMVVGSRYPRDKLKRRLIAEGIKGTDCEMCGQGQDWNGQRMSMVLDHINGVANDHRLENLRMVCPNCAATLDTHCGRNIPRERTCPSCQRAFEPLTRLQRYCSHACWGPGARERFQGVAHPETRKVERPPYDQLRKELAASNFSAVGRAYGVSDNAVRKWLRWYEREQVRATGGHTGGGPDGLTA